MTQNDDIDWKPLQFFKKDFSLNDIIKPEILKKFKEEFDVDEAIPVSLAIAITDKNNTKELVSLTHQTPEDIVNGIILVAMNNRDSFEKVKKVFKE